MLQRSGHPIGFELGLDVIPKRLVDDGVMLAWIGFVFVNDLASRLPSEPVKSLYADDVALLRAHHSKESAAEALAGRGLVSEWASASLTGIPHKKKKITTSSHFPTLSIDALEKLLKDFMLYEN